MAKRKRDADEVAVQALLASAPQNRGNLGTSVANTGTILAPSIPTPAPAPGSEPPAKKSRTARGGPTSLTKSEKPRKPYTRKTAVPARTPTPDMNTSRGQDNDQALLQQQRIAYGPQQYSSPADTQYFDQEPAIFPPAQVQQHNPPAGPQHFDGGYSLGTHAPTQQLETPAGLPQYPQYPGSGFVDGGHEVAGYNSGALGPVIPSHTAPRQTASHQEEFVVLPPPSNYMRHVLGQELEVFGAGYLLDDQPDFLYLRDVLMSQGRVVVLVPTSLQNDYQLEFGFEPPVDTQAGMGDVYGSEPLNDTLTGMGSMMPDMSVPSLLPDAELHQDGDRDPETGNFWLQGKFRSKQEYAALIFQTRQNGES